MAVKNIVKIVKRSDTQQIRIQPSEFRNKNFVDIREYYSNDGEMAPTKKGISIPVELFADVMRNGLEVLKRINKDEWREVVGYESEGGVAADKPLIEQRLYELIEPAGKPWKGSGSNPAKKEIISLILNDSEEIAEWLDGLDDDEGAIASAMLKRLAKGKSIPADRLDAFLREFAELYEAHAEDASDENDEEGEEDEEDEEEVGDGELNQLAEALNDIDLSKPRTKAYKDGVQAVIDTDDLIDMLKGEGDTKGAKLAKAFLQDISKFPQLAQHLIDEYLLLSDDEDEDGEDE